MFFMYLFYANIKSGTNELMMSLTLVYEHLSNVIEFTLLNGFVYLNEDKFIDC